MRRCAANDCNCNSPELPLCCFDCQDREQCPDRCPRTSTVYCTCMVEEYNDKDKSRTIKE